MSRPTALEFAPMRSIRRSTILPGLLLGSAALVAGVVGHSFALVADEAAPTLTLRGSTFASGGGSTSSGGAARKRRRRS